MKSAFVGEGETVSYVIHDRRSHKERSLPGTLRKPSFISFLLVPRPQLPVSDQPNSRSPQENIICDIGPRCFLAMRPRPAGRLAMLHRSLDVLLSIPLK